jgi:hypothetical protein
MAARVVAVTLAYALTTVAGAHAGLPDVWTIEGRAVARWSFRYASDGFSVSRSSFYSYSQQRGVCQLRAA